MSARCHVSQQVQWQDTECNLIQVSWIRPIVSNIVGVLESKSLWGPFDKAFMFVVRISRHIQAAAQTVLLISRMLDL